MLETNKPVRNIREFLERDCQAKFNDGQEYMSDGNLLNGDEWPRVEELDVDEPEDDNVELEGIVSPGTKELQLLSDFVSRISSSLRLDSQQEKIDLVSDESKTSMADDAVKEDDVFLTRLPKQFSKKKLDFAHIYNSKVVEAAIFPGMDADATKLPNNVLIESIILKAVQKIQDSTKKMNRKWIKLLCSKRSCNIVSDAFWYIWHHQFNKDDQVQASLLERISNIFVDFFVNCTLSNHSKDEFFKIYPNIISIVVWYGFMESFPKSQKHFGLSFQTIICDYLAEWIMGIVPVNPWCLEWDALETIKAETSKADAQVTPGPAVNPGILTFSFSDLIMFSPNNDQKEKVEKKPRESCKMGPSHKIIKNRFDVYQNSPIVSKYLKTAGFHKYHGSLIVHRSQVIRETLDPNIPTYRQVITESSKNASSYFQQYKEKIKKAGKEKLSIIQETSLYLSKEESQQKSIMNNPNLIKEKAHSILQQMAQSVKMRKEKIIAKRKQDKVI